MWVCTHTQSLQSCLTLWTQGLYPTRVLCPWHSPSKNMEWVDMSSSRGSSQPRSWIWDSCGSWSAGGFLTTEQLSLCGWASSVDGLNKKADPPLSRRELFLPDCLQIETLAFSGPRIQTEPLAPLGSWSCWPSDRDYTIGSACSSLCRSWNLPSSIIMLSNPLQ